MSDAAATHYIQQLCSVVVRTSARDHEGILRLEIVPGSTAPDGTPSQVVGAGQIFVKEQEVRLCNACGQAGHIKQDCPTPDAKTICRHCNSVGHKAANCPTPDANTLCRNCNTIGHKAAGCPNGKGKGGRGCFNCGQMGHKKSTCNQPARTKQMAGNVTQPAGPSPQPVGTMEAEDDEDATIAPRINTFDTYPPGAHLHAILETHISEGNEAAIQLKLRSTYMDSSQKSGHGNSIAIARFTSANIERATLRVVRVEPDNKDIERLLDDETHTKVVNQEAALDESTLYHLQFTTMFDPRYNDGNLLGVGLYSDRSHGPYTPTIHAIRDAFKNHKRVVVHFFVLESSSFAERISDLQTALEENRAMSPWTKWWPHGRLSVQMGQQLLAHERPSHAVPRRLQFDNDQQWLTTHFYGVVSELEALQTADWVETRVVLVEYTGAKETLIPSYFAVVNMATNLLCSPCSHIQLRFLGPDADESKDWSGMVLPRTPWGSSFTYEVFIRRPLLEGEFLDTPEFKREHILRAVDYRQVEELATAVKRHPGIRVWARATLPRSSLEREINTLRIADRGGNGFALEKAILRGNLPSSLPHVNFFKAHMDRFGVDKVKASQDFAIKHCHLNRIQQEMFLGMSDMTAGIWIVDGPPGVGKTELIKALAVYGYVLTRDLSNTEPGFGMWFLSPMNLHLNGMMERIHNVLIDLWETSQANGFSYRYPVTPREHACATDTSLYKKHAVNSRQTVGIDIDPFAELDEECSRDLAGLSGEDPQLLLSSLCQDSVLRSWYSKYTGSSRSDQRVISNPSLAHGQMMLDIAGVKDAHGNRHPMSQGYEDQFAQFRHLLEAFAAGKYMTSEDKTALTVQASAVRKALNQRADVRGMTYHILSHTRSHTDSSPSIVCHDEAGKTSETQALHALFLARPYTEGKGGLVVDSNMPPIPHLFCGDLNQPRPVTGPNTNRAFHDQKGVPLFARLLCGGFRSIKFTEQYRYVGDICNLVNATMPQEELTTHPSVYDRPQVEPCRRLIWDLFGKNSAFVFAALASTTGKHMHNESAYNLDSAAVVMGLARRAIDGNYLQGKDIGIATPYVAQRDVYLAAKQGLVKEFLDKHKPTRAREAAEISIFTVDSLQGLQCAFILFDPVVTTDMGFVKDISRWLLAISRPQSGLIIVCAEKQLQSAHTADKHKTRAWHKSPIYAAIAHAKEKRVYIDLDSPRWGDTLSTLRVGFTFGSDLRALHEDGDLTPKPYDYSLADADEDDFVPNFPPHSQYNLEEFLNVPNHPYAENKSYREALWLISEHVLSVAKPISAEEHLIVFEADPYFQNQRSSFPARWSANRNMIEKHGLSCVITNVLLEVAQDDLTMAWGLCAIIRLYAEVSDNVTRKYRDKPEFLAAPAMLAYEVYQTAVQANTLPEQIAIVEEALRVFAPASTSAGAVTWASGSGAGSGESWNTVGGGGGSGASWNKVDGRDGRGVRHSWNNLGGGGDGATCVNGGDDGATYVDGGSW